ncbi:Pyridoxal-dependent decarboxylase conserved domain-containing protein [Cladophialophora immunda]|nr:Pyridoxal-dependent decarboxylase conserved domain-containing protein [Cladophialophora immunda]
MTQRWLKQQQIDSNKTHNMDRSSDQLLESALKVVELSVANRQGISDQPIVKITQPEVAQRFSNLAKPRRQPTPIDTILEDARDVFDHRIRMDHPRFFGFIPSPASDWSWLGEVLNSAFNTHAGSWFQSSGPSAIEQSLISWLAQDLLGFPPTAGGCFVSGGSMANLSALMVARDQKLDFEERARAIVYTSEQTHSSIAKGLRILGFHDKQIAKIECDQRYRLNTAALELRIEEDRRAGKKPFLVVGSCGTPNTGSVDPLEELAAIAQKEDLWFHVDGAYGASAALSKCRKSLIKGVELCDSISWDAHKWLFQTYGCGMVLVRDRKLLIDSFRTGAEYTQDASDGPEEYPNFWNYTPELTRPARAMKLWFCLQALGLDAVENAIEHAFELAETAQVALEKLDCWQVLSSAQMGIVCFRYEPPGLDEAALETLNKDISRIAIEDNVAAALTTRLSGKLVIRICSMHPDLTKDEMAQIILDLDQIARAQMQHQSERV